MVCSNESLKISSLRSNWTHKMVSNGQEKCWEQRNPKWMWGTLIYSSKQHFINFTVVWGGFISSRLEITGLAAIFLCHHPSWWNLLSSLSHSSRKHVLLFWETGGYWNLGTGEMDFPINFCLVDISGIKWLQSWNNINCSTWDGMGGKLLKPSGWENFLLQITAKRQVSLIRNFSFLTASYLH